ncbi:MAG: hypothetical protein LBJ02_09725 [Bifidobacteriaceae bacterium]|jgi:hypothetical protein|nr:hypothetical protein [Bifidobacteriaceae bacterium]
MVLRRPPSGMLCGVLAIVFAVASGCALEGEGEDVPGSTASESFVDPVQARTAAELVACLDGLGVDARTTPMDITGHAGQYANVAIGSVEDPIEWNFPGVMGVYDPSKYGDDFDELLLVANGVDLTAEFSACIESSGFYLPDPDVDPRDEEVAKLAIAEASNQWAACARKNGLPALPDAVVVVDGWETRPSIEIPASVDLQLFEKVLDACPPLDPNRDLSKGNLVEEGEEVPVDPEITFAPRADSGELEEMEGAMASRIRELFESAQG